MPAVSHEKDKGAGIVPSPTWNFPPNNEGREDGLNDPGIETFRDDPLRSLAREVAQNSLDAADPDAGKPVEVHFSLVDLPIAKFPDAGHFTKTLAACLKYWKANDAPRKFFLRTQDVMKTKSVRLLRIQDYNTTGLTGPFDQRTSHWFKLTKAIGASDKEGGQGGSFGIGKHAPFACSELRTVLYGTRDKRGEFAFQGVSKLVTHKRASGITTQGTGYFGWAARNAPITKQSEVDRAFRRSQVGTDIYVLGFLRAADWETQITKGLVESFFVAIERGRLVARVGETLVNRESLPDLVKKFAAAEKGWVPAAYYQALTSEEAFRFAQDDFEGLGEIELRAMTGADFPKRVAMVRSTGMKIFDKAHFQTPLRFAGVFIASGEAINAFLRALEPPSHNAWVAERYTEDPAYARSILKKLIGWLHDCIRTLAADVDMEELDAEGISQFLPDDVEDDAAPGADAAAEGERNEPITDIPVAFRTYKPEHMRGAAVAESGPNDGEQPLLEGDDPIADHDGQGDEANQTDDAGSGVEAETAADDGGGPAPRRIGLHRVRVFCTDEVTGRYRIICQPEESGTGFLTVRVIGEVGQEAAPITEFITAGAAPQKPPRPGVVGPLALSERDTLQLDVLLEGAPHCALGVTAHAG